MQGSGEVEKTFILLKPDCIRKGISGEVLAHFEQNGLRIVALRMAKPKRDEWARHYAHHAGKPFFESLLNFMGSAPVICAVLAGENAVERARTLCGATDPAQAAEGTVRRNWGTSIQANVVHASDSAAAAETEIKRFFKTSEIFE